MNGRVTVKDLDQAFVDCLNRYIDDREAVLYNDLNLDREVLLEVTAIYRVVSYMRADNAIRPLPGTLKRLIGIKHKLRQSLSARNARTTFHRPRKANFR